MFNYLALKSGSKLVESRIMAKDEAAWPSDFKRLDAVLRCGICYEYMNNSMITSCSHTYCSVCIRRFMMYRNQCPACFEETYEVHLRNNRPLDEVISIFIKNKDKLIQALQLVSTDAKDSSNPNCGVTVRKVLGAQPSTSKGDVNGAKLPGIFNVRQTGRNKSVKMAECPVCRVEVPDKSINLHLDACLADQSESRHKPSPKVKKRLPLPKRLYHLMPDKALKSVLKEFNLSTNGNRRALISRIQRYTVIYNAENDAPNPRPVSQLIAQLEREEREENKPNQLKLRNRPKIVIDRNSKPEVIESANKAYCEDNKECFKKLIEGMREREGRNIRPLKPGPRIDSEEESPGGSSASNAAEDPDLPSTSNAALSDDPVTNATHPSQCPSLEEEDFAGFPDTESSPLKNHNQHHLSGSDSSLDTIIDSPTPPDRGPSLDLQALSGSRGKKRALEGDSPEKPASEPCPDKCELLESSPQPTSPGPSRSRRKVTVSVESPEPTIRRTRRDLTPQL